MGDELTQASRDEADLTALGRVGFIGAGAVASTLARALALRGAAVVGVTARESERAATLAASLPNAISERDAAAVIAGADMIFLAVPDDALTALDAALAWRPTHSVIHLSGARGAAALAHATASGAAVAALHPLLSFPSPAADGHAALARLAGCTWALETPDARLAGKLEALVAALGGRTVRLRAADRAPYHLAAVLASNYVVVLLGAAVALWQDFGVEPPIALDALLPLLRSAVENLAAVGPARALTGPLARGDVSTVAAHLAWLVQQESATAARHVDAAALDAAYRALAELAIPLALARGTLSEQGAQALRALLASES